VKAFARAVRLLHDGVPITTCPFTASIESKLGPDAVNRTATTTTTTTTPQRPRLIQRALSRSLPPPPIPDSDRVFSHGDCCLPNILFNDSGVLGGFIDLGEAGECMGVCMMMMVMMIMMMVVVMMMMMMMVGIRSFATTVAIPANRIDR